MNKPLQDLLIDYMCRQIEYPQLMIELDDLLKQQLITEKDKEIIMGIL